VSADPTGGPARLDPEAARQAARSILSRPEFARPPQNPLDRLRHWVGQRLSELLGSILGGHLTLIGWIVLLVVVAASVVLAARLVRLPRHRGSAAGMVVDGPRRHPADWLNEAAGCEARGDYLGALRARYRALLAELAHRGYVDEIPGRTTGEYRREVADALPLAAPEFDGITDLLEAAVYGAAPTGRAEAARMDELTGRVRARAR